MKIKYFLIVLIILFSLFTLSVIAQSDIYACMEPVVVRDTDGDGYGESTPTGEPTSVIPIDQIDDSYFGPDIGTLYLPQIPFDQYFDTSIACICGQRRSRDCKDGTTAIDRCDCLGERCGWTFGVCGAGDDEEIIEFIEVPEEERKPYPPEHETSSGTNEKEDKKEPGFFKKIGNFFANIFQPSKQKEQTYEPPQEPTCVEDSSGTICFDSNGKLISYTKNEISADNPDAKIVTATKLASKESTDSTFAVTPISESPTQDTKTATVAKSSERPSTTVRSISKGTQSLNSVQQPVAITRLKTQTMTTATAADTETQTGMQPSITGSAVRNINQQSSFAVGLLVFLGLAFLLGMGMYKNQ